MCTTILKLSLVIPGELLRHHPSESGIQMWPRNGPQNVSLVVSNISHRFRELQVIETAALNNPVCCSHNTTKSSMRVHTVFTGDVCGTVG